VDLRTMLDAATGYREDVEPDEVVHTLVVITAYAVDP
jgi:hypothetical protein